MGDLDLIMIEGHSLKIPYLARVLPSHGVSGADEYFRDMFDVTGVPVHGLAHRVVDDGEIHFLHRRG